MPTTDGDSVQRLEQQRGELKSKLAQVGDLRPGSLVERYRRCGKAGCHCAARGAEGHGPSWSLTREVGGKTVTRVIPAAAVAQTRQHVAEYQRFRSLVREMVETSEQLCDAKVDAVKAAPDKEAAKKGASKKGSRKPSTRTSSRRSKRS
jgi:uncharacterized protein DUF6788